MSNIFVTSDSHFNHTNICGPTISKWTGGGYRNFSALEEMNNIIINNINAIVMPDDVLYHLGDFAFGNKQEIPKLRERIACRTIHFLYGNHDEAIEHKFPEFQKLFTSVGHYKEIRHGGILITMFHYPIGSWNEIGRGAIQLHGHCHGNYQRTIGKQMDVGLDANEFKPHLLDDVVKKMSTIDIVLTDHHNERTNYG